MPLAAAAADLTPRQNPAPSTIVMQISEAQDRDELMSQSHLVWRGSGRSEVTLPDHAKIGRQKPRLDTVTVDVRRVADAG